MAETGTSNAVSPESASPSRRKSSKGLLLAGTVVLSLLGFGTWQAVRFQSPADASPAGVRTVLALESFTVNLADPEEGRFLRTTFSLGVDGEVPAAGEGGKAAEGGSGVSIAAIRDSLLSVLAQCKSGELLLPQGKAKLKADLLNALNREVPALEAREVYFTEFLVQR